MRKELYLQNPEGKILKHNQQCLKTTTSKPSRKSTRKAANRQIRTTVSSPSFTQSELQTILFFFFFEKFPFFIGLRLMLIDPLPIFLSVGKTERVRGTLQQIFFYVSRSTFYTTGEVLRSEATKKEQKRSCAFGPSGYRSSGQPLTCFLRNGIVRKTIKTASTVERTDLPTRMQVPSPPVSKLSNTETLEEDPGKNS